MLVGDLASSPPCSSINRRKTEYLLEKRVFLLWCFHSNKESPHSDKILDGVSTKEILRS